MGASSHHFPSRQRLVATIIAVSAIGFAQMIAAGAMIKILALPLFGGLAGGFLIYRAIQLFLPPTQRHREDSPESFGSIGFGSLVAKVVFANLISSGDNIVAVAAASEGHASLAAIGLLLSFPIVAFGSVAFVHLVKRFPIILIPVAGRLGYVAGSLIVLDPLWSPWLSDHLRTATSISPGVIAFTLALFSAWRLFVQRPVPLGARTGERRHAAE
jgi:predicted tellurium resistance membrane protein TerC